MDKSTLKKDRMRFTKNKASANLTYLAILLNVLYFVSIYSVNLSYFYTINMGASVVYNLLFLLTAFLASEGVKNYKLSLSVVLVVIGALQIVRIFKIPMEAASTLVVVDSVERYVMEAPQFIYTVILLIGSAACCICAGILGIIRTKALREYVNSIGADLASVEEN